MTTIVANWKMNGSANFALKYLDKIKQKKDVNTLVICPPFPYLSLCSKEIISRKDIFIGAQSVSFHSDGQFTGQVSAQMLADCGCKYTIVSHSEQRKHTKLNSKNIINAVENLQINNIIPIVCFGNDVANEESINEMTEEIRKVTSECGEIILAYEPIYAIGAPNPPSTDDISKVIAKIQTITSAKNNITIIYGGSVRSENAREIMQITGLSGLIIGGASLNPESILGILDMV